MDIKRLEIFCAVVELKSFTRAAEAVLLSQPTVSENIRLLEETCGSRLLDRLGREVLPTAAGQILFQYARRIIRLRDEALQAIESHKGHLSGNLILGASTIPGAYILPSLVQGFKSLHPEIQITLNISDTSRTVEALLQGHLELGFIGARLKDQLLECREYSTDELVLAVPPDHRWAGQPPLDPTALLEEPFILRERGSGTRLVMLEALKELSVEVSQLQVVAEMGSTEAVRQAIKAGIGVSILSSLSVAEDLQRGSLVQVPIKGLKILRPIYLVQRKNRQISPLAQAFLDHLRTDSPI